MRLPSAVRFLVGMALGIVGCAMSGGVAPLASHPPTPPPSPLPEIRTGPENPHQVWAPGYWHWDNVRYVWVPGHWEPEGPGSPSK